MTYYTITIQPGTLITADEFLRLPKEDGWHYELVEGRIVRMPLAGYNHDVITFHLAVALGSFVEEHHLGECTLSQAGYLLSQPGEPDTVRGPDLAFISTSRIPPPGSSESVGFPRLAPDLVVEVVSPSQYRPEMIKRVQMWLSAGVRLAWIIWPQSRQVEVWRPGSQSPVVILGDTDTLDGRDVVPGFTCPIARLFR